MSLLQWHAQQGSQILHSMQLSKRLFPVHCSALERTEHFAMSQPVVVHKSTSSKGCQAWVVYLSFVSATQIFVLDLDIQV